MYRLPYMTALLLLLTSLVPSWGARTRAAASDPLVVIMGRSAAVHDISLGVLRQVFRGERAVLPDGRRLVPFNQSPRVPERLAFDRAVLELEPDEVGRFWIQRRIRDEGSPPRIVSSAALGLRVVAAYPGAITYLRASQVSGNVHVLAIDGKLPGEAGYLLPAL